MRIMSAGKEQIPPLFPSLDAGDPAKCKGLKRNGIVPSQTLRKLVEDGHILAGIPLRPGQIQPASVDLRLGPVGYEVRSSFLPGEDATVEERLAGLLVRRIDLTSAAVLQKGRVYIVPLIEELCLPSHMAGKANPKSSTGRLDVFTRLITDRCQGFENVAPGYRGKLYAEIFPRTFSVLVRQGSKLNQLRLGLGQPTLPPTTLRRLHRAEPLVFRDDGSPCDDNISGNSVLFSVELSPLDGSRIVGYKARKDRPIIDVDRVNYYEPCEFWEPIEVPSGNGIVLEPNDFYILASKERVRVLPKLAAEMMAYDSALGEFRVHYAGFFDPGFGYGHRRPPGTRAVLEVRSHEVPFLLENGQVVGRLTYEHLLEPPLKLYGTELGSFYQNQALALGKQFKRPATTTAESAVIVPQERRDVVQ
jgi:dCTP deaminase